MTQDQQAAVDFRNAEREDPSECAAGSRCHDCNAKLTDADENRFYDDDDNPQGFYLCASCEATMADMEPLK